MDMVIYMAYMVPLVIIESGAAPPRTATGNKYQLKIISDDVPWQLLHKHAIKLVSSANQKN